MNEESYVLLTGAMNNAGDFLISQRSKQLLCTYRKDRILYSIDRWKPLTSKDLDTINASKALLLTGGPAVRSNIYPGIFPLTSHLDDIEVPIITYGVGWKHHSLDPTVAYRYRFSPESEPLLDRLSSNGCMNSVRDYESQIIFSNAGLSNVLVTGCPVLYAPQDEIKLVKKRAKSSIVFSLGVAYRNSKGMEEQAKQLILELRNEFEDLEVIVALHHSTDLSNSGASSKAITEQHEAQMLFLAWLNERQVKYVDVSGSADNMLNLYSNAVIHIGYRVHAHILMTSWGAPSILVAEDSRGVSMARIAGGPVFLGIGTKPLGLLGKVAAKTVPGISIIRPVTDLASTIINYIREYSMSRASADIEYVDRNSPEIEYMQQFMDRLP